MKSRGLIGGVEDAEGAILAVVQVRQDRVKEGEGGLMMVENDVENYDVYRLLNDTLQRFT